MRQKNYKWVFYILILVVLGGIIYVAAKDITPISRHIETEAAIDFGKN